MQNTSSNRNTTIILMVSAVLTLAVIMTVLGYCEFVPFGNKSLLILDFRSQYMDFLTSFKRVLLGEENIFYSFSRTLGGDYYSIACYYLFSPFNLLLLIANDKNLHLVIILIYCLKTIASALACSLFLLKTHIAENKGGIYLRFIPVLTLLYTFCGFTTIYSMNIIWLDAIWLLPLSALALEKLLYHKNGIYFSMLIALNIITNFYMGIMIIVFLALYYLFLKLMWKSLVSRSAGRFIFYLGTGISISAIVFIPVILYLARTKMSNNNYFAVAASFLGSDITTLLDRICVIWLFAGIAILAYLLYKRVFRPFPAVTDITAGSGVSKYLWLENIALFAAFLVLTAIYLIHIHTVRGPGLSYLYRIFLKFLPMHFSMVSPQLYTGSVIFIFILLLLINFRKSTYNANIKVLLLIMILISPLIFRQMDLLLHLGQKPVFFPARYTFIISFGLIIVSAYTIDRYIPAVDSRSFAVILGKCSIALKNRWINVFIILVIMELAVNTVSTFQYLNDTNSGYLETYRYDMFADENQQALSYIDDDTFYRTEKTYFRYMNDALSLNYFGMTHFSSMYDNATITFLKKLGFSTNIYASTYFGSTPLTDALFSIKYVLYTDDTDFMDTTYSTPYGYSYVEELYTEIARTKYLHVYENNDALSLAYIVSDDFPGFSLQNAKANPFENQNQFISYLLGKDTRVFTECNAIQSVAAKDLSMDFQLDVSTDGPLFMYVNSDMEVKTSIYSNGVLVSPYRSSIPSYFYTTYLGSFKKGDVVHISIVPQKKLIFGDIFFYSMDTGMYKAAINLLEKHEPAVTHFSENRLSLSTDEEGILFTTIPYSNAWTVTINGNPAKTFAGADGTFLCVRLNGGTQDIVFEYVPAGFKNGLKISLLFICVFALAISCRRHSRTLGKPPV